MIGITSASEEIANAEQAFGNVISDRACECPATTFSQSAIE